VLAGALVVHSVVPAVSAPVGVQVFGGGGFSEVVPGWAFPKCEKDFADGSALIAGGSFDR